MASLDLALNVVHVLFQHTVVGLVNLQLPPPPPAAGSLALPFNLELTFAVGARPLGAGPPAGNLDLNCPLLCSAATISGGIPANCNPWPVVSAAPGLGVAPVVSLNIFNISPALLFI